jgi:outer membrane receptor protein involved in Fe transport
MRKSLWLLSAGLASLSVPAQAQQTDTDRQSAVPTDGATSEAASVDDEAREEQPVDTSDIVVTATRRNEALSDVPLAVSAVTADTLENSGATDIRQLSQLSPSLFVSSSSTEAGGASARIRGIGTVGDNPGLESSVGLFVDGVYRSRTSVGLTELGALERVEVLRGPQGTLFGRNTSAGLISVITAKPRFTTAVNGQLDLGNYDMRRLELGATGPISSTLAGRIDGVYFKRDGFMKDVVSGRRINDRDRWLLRGQLLYQPDDDLSVRLIADKTKRDEECCVGSYLPAFDRVTDGNGGYTLAPSSITSFMRGLGATINEDTFARQVALTPGRTFRADVDDQGVSAELVYDTGGPELTWISAYRENLYRRAQDADFNNLDILHRADNNWPGNRFRTFSQEARVQGTALEGRLDWLVGGYYASELLRVRDNLSYGADADLFGRGLIRSLSPDLAAFPGFNLLNPFVRGFALTRLAGTPIPAAGQMVIANAIAAQVVNTPLANTGSQDEYNQESSNVAVFTHNIFQVTDRISATVGLRYTREKKSLEADLFSNTQCAAYQANVTRLLAFAANPGLGALSAAASQLATGLAIGEGSTPGLREAGAAACAVNSVSGTFQNGRKKEAKFSGTAVLSYKPTEDLLTYASFSRGYKAGGFNLDRAGLIKGAENLNDLRFEPEMVNAFELGGKYNGRGLDVNVAVFRQDFENFQLNTFNGITFVVENINSCSESLNGADTDNSTAVVACGGSKRAGVRSQGIEVESFIRLIPDVTAALGATFASTKYRKNLIGAQGNAIPPALFQLPGRRISNSSKLSLTGSLGWRPALGAAMRGLFYIDARRMSEFNTGSDLDIEKLQDAFTVVNARVGVHGASERWGVELWAQNLFDKDYRQVAFDAPLQGQRTSRGVAAGFYPRSTQLYGAFLGEPRTFGLTLRGKM